MLTMNKTQWRNKEQRQAKEKGCQRLKDAKTRWGHGSGEEEVLTCIFRIVRDFRVIIVFLKCFGFPLSYDCRPRTLLRALSSALWRKSNNYASLNLQLYGNGYALLKYLNHALEFNITLLTITQFIISVKRTCFHGIAANWSFIST